MKKKILSALLATLMLATMLSGCGGKKDDSTSSNGGNGSGTVSSRVWKFSHTRAEGTDNDIMANKFADSLMENLDGLQIDMYPNNQLGDYTVVQEAVGLDEVQLMLGSMSNGVDPTLSVQIAPYLVNNWDDAYEFYNSDDGIITNYVRESLEKQNIHLLAVMPKYFGAIMTTKPASNIEDPAASKGVKIRVQKSPIAVEMMKAFGGSATPVDWGELYTALQSNVVDGAENNSPSVTTAFHHEVVKYYTVNEHTMCPDVIILSLATWNKLSEQERGWLRQAADEAALYQRQLWAEQEQASMVEMREKGIEIIYPDKQPFVEAAQPMLDKFRNDPQFEKLIKKIEETQ